MDALNLFSTIWGLIEAPRATFRKIVLAKHKNYALLLSVAFGISVAFNIAWYMSLGRIFPRVSVIVVGAFVLGPFLGILMVYCATVVLGKATAFMGGIAQRRNLFASLAYATTPMVISLIFLVPIEFAVFGSDFFGTNPPPSLIKPLEYKVLIGFKWIALLCTIYLATEGTLAANAFDRKGFLPVVMLVTIQVVALIAALHYLMV